MCSVAVDPHSWLVAHSAELAHDRRRWVIDQLLQGALSDFPELADPDLRDELAALATECLRSLTVTATLPRDTWIDPDLPVAGIAFCRSLARRGHDLVIIFRLFRTGHARFWRAIMEIAETEIADPELQRGVLAIMWERLSRWQDFVVDQLVHVYQDERERWLRGALAQRGALIETILDGRDVAPERAVAVLGHDLRLFHTAFTIRTHDRLATGDRPDDLEAVAADLAAALGASRALTVRSGANALWAWVTTPAQATGAGLADAAARHPNVRITAGRSTAGLDGFRRSHADALAAHRVTMAARAPQAFTHYADVELTALLSGNPRGLDRFVEHELGPLVEARHARLCRTLLALLRAGGNHTAAAHALGVHRNTVRHHVDRAQRLRGRALDPTRLETHLALMLAVEVDTSRLDGADGPALEAAASTAR